MKAIIKTGITKPSFALIVSTALFGCSNADNGTTSWPDRTMQACANKPNCVSTLDHRPQHQLTAFNLTEAGSNHWPQITRAALSLPGASLGQQGDNYIRVECRSRIFGFIDDFEIRKQGKQLIIRSESRTGYSDFGVNRERAERFRRMLSEAGFISDMHAQ